MPTPQLVMYSIDPMRRSGGTSSRWISKQRRTIGSGPQLMKGYWNDPRFTEEKTVQIDGRRYYKSGDVCRWLPDGNLDYVGRVDEEVKVSGFRINLNEIKRVLDSTHCVKEGHPLVLIHPTLGKVIAVCFTRAGEALPDDDLFRALNQTLKDALPYYMVPSLYFLFDRIPQLPSGKTDKNGIQHLADQWVQRRPNGVTRFVCS